ncbi:hypothetical protein [Chroococcidiopsis sp.]|uniref:hypothetical protein n=1 Tax=Chroococcidiopsis sp. TaxID=3088168 RepID=UPI003F2DF35B
MKLLSRSPISIFGFEAIKKVGGSALGAMNGLGTASMIAGLVIPDATTRSQAKLQEDERKKLAMLNKNPELLKGLNNLRNTAPAPGSFTSNPRPNVNQPPAFPPGSLR